MTPLRLMLKIEEWPAPDRAAWHSLFAEGSVFDSLGPCAHWSAGTRRKRANSYGFWLGFLKNCGRLNPDASPADRITPEAMRAFVDATRERITLVSTTSQIVDLYILAQNLDCDRDWDWFERIMNRLRRQTGRWQLKPRAGISSADIFAWAIAEMAAADAIEFESGHMERSVRFRDGLMIALLAARPLRLRSFIGIEIDTHLVPSGEAYLLRFRPEDMKDRKAREFDLPAQLVEPMRRYLNHYRPTLLRGSTTETLWVSQRGGALTQQGFAERIAVITEHAFGEALRPHAFRHIAATSIAEEDPAHVNVIASLLGHATLDMSQKHYNRASGVKAAASYQEMIRELRRAARRRERSRHNIRGDAARRDVAD